MPNITVKNIPQGLYDRLKKEAKRNHRSLNGEIIAQLEQVGNVMDRNEIIQNTRYTRGLPRETVSEEFIDYAKKSGRK